MVKKLLVPLKFNHESIQVIKYAIDFAKEKNAKITLLHVLKKRGNMDSPEQMFSDGEMRRKAEFHLSKIAKDIIHPNNIDYEIIISEGSEKEKVVEFTINFNINYLILGETLHNELLECIGNKFKTFPISKGEIHQNDIYTYML